MSLPVWLYWEGPQPRWIAACIETIVRHAADARLLGPAEFARLHQGECDLDLGRLHVAHRADYIRAFLLARYGGLWVDCDCVVLRPLTEVLDLIEQKGFVGHYERQGRISNAFIGSRPGGRIAEAHLANVTRLIRSGTSLSWLALGSSSLMEALRQSGQPWHRLAVELVQPICWSDPGAFLVRGSSEQHDARVNPRAYCYMLSKNTMEGRLAANPGEDLMTGDTFFQHLLRRSAAGPPADVTACRPPVRFRPELLPFCLTALADIAPARVLDLAPGAGRWGVLIREACEEGVGRVHRESWRTSVEAVMPNQGAVEEYHHFLYSWIHVANPVGFLEGSSDHWDLALITESLPEDWTPIVLAALERSAYVLITCEVCDEADIGCRASDLLAWRPIRHVLHPGPDGDHGAFLFSRTDPLGLRRDQTIQALFTRIFRDNLWLESESRSGPGSSLVHTSVLRARLPALLASVGTRSLLDIGCGDLNWMRHVDLGEIDYVGVDVVPRLIAHNQLDFGHDHRRFVLLDLMRDALPRADAVLLRDVLVHLSFEDALSTLANIRRSGSKYLIATTFPGHRRNDPIQTGGWRPLNLQMPPFCLPAPIDLVNEACTEGDGQYADKSLGLWRLSDVLC